MRHYTWIFTLLIASVIFHAEAAKAATPKVKTNPSTKLRAGKPLKIYIMTGQSNMEGHAREKTLAGLAMDPKTKALYEKLADKDGKARVYKDISVAAFTAKKKEMVKTGPLTVGFGAGFEQDKMGTEFAFGVTLYEHLKEPILIIKASWGGKDLNRQFRPPSAGPFPISERDLAQADTEKGKKKISWLKESTGEYYRLLVKHVKTVLADPAKYCSAYDPEQGVELAGFIWFQGWNDVIAKLYKNHDYSEYTRLLSLFIKDLRKEFQAPDMPFVVGIIGFGGEDTDGPGVLGLRKAQAAIADIEEFKGNVIAVPTAPYWDKRMEDLTQIKLAAQAPETKKGRKKTYAERDPEGKWADRRARYQAWKKEIEANKPGKDASKGEQRKWYVQWRWGGDDKIFTPEELEYMEKNSSNAGLHYYGSAKTYSQMGEAFANALINLE